MDRTTLLLLVFAFIAFRIIMHFIDKSRIRREIEVRGGRVNSIKWNPFARGWFFEKNERHYNVSYIDRSGMTISTTCKTSLFTGVYWAEGPAIAPPKRILPRHRCQACGYPLSVEWRACPNCGQAL